MHDFCAALTRYPSMCVETWTGQNSKFSVGKRNLPAPRQAPSDSRPAPRAYAITVSALAPVPPALSRTTALFLRANGL